MSIVEFKLKFLFCIFLVFVFSNPVFASFSPNNQTNTKQIKKLRKEINKHNKNYFLYDNPTISDSDYDILVKKLNDLEKNNPNSKTTKTIGAIDSKTAKTKHKNKMYSLKKVYELDKLEQWYKKIASIEPYTIFCAEPKIDGLALTLFYENGRFIKGLTRGNGELGEDVTKNLNMINSIPKNLKKSFSGEIRGEVYVSIDEFIKQNKETKFSTPRNYAAGSLRQKDPEITNKRNLSFIAYQILSKNPPKTQIESLKTLQELGFSANSYKELKNFSEIKDYLKNFNSCSQKIPTDGVVIKVNDIELQEKLGFDSYAPKWAIAYKFSPKTANTKLESIEFTIGKSGTLTPVAIFSPVEILGSKFNKATLHNLSQIKKLDLYINDEITIKKAGEILPEIVFSTKTKDSKKIALPKTCPYCNSKLIIENKNLQCANSNCKGRIAAKIAHFASRDAMNIKGLANNVALKLVSIGIKDYSQIYELKETDFKDLAGFSDKSAKNLYLAVQNSKNTDLERFLYAISINYLGKTTASILAQNYKNLDEIKKASLIDLQKIDGIGEKTAESVFNFFRDEKNLQEIEKLQNLGVNLN